MFSIIVPTYNEEKDIFRTLNSLEGLDWPDYEVVVVDDGSKDKTAEIVKAFTDRLPNFRLLKQEVNRGVSAVRNIGIQEARGEVVVILNADALLPKDFLNRIAPYYQQGKKWVAVADRVINREKAYPRFIEAQSYHRYFIKKEHWVWTEGFSCSRDAAISVGLFPEAMPGCSGEDVDFGLNLEKKYPGVRALEVVVPHVAPDNIKEFWQQQQGRGKGRTNYYRYMKNMGVAPLFLNSLLSSCWRALKMICLVPLFRALKFSKYSDRGRRDFLPFTGAGYVAEAAMVSGIWKAFGKIINKK